ncbi:MAG TPA: Arm DNA-binding domain-containing protein [Mycobacteriales bacterium]|nr:Arm DNA-binding domain-containing protein [Mycobacteriales bacterium]
MDTTCPRLRWSNHGSWYFYVALPPIAGRRRRVRQGGFETEHEAREAMQEVLDRAGVAISATGDHPSVIDTIRGYLATALSPIPTPGTRSRVRRGVRPWVRRLDLIRLSSIPRRKGRP